MRQIFRDVNKRAILLKIIDKVRPGSRDLRLANRFGAGPDGIEPIGMRIRQRPDQDILHHTQHCGCCTNPDAESQDDNNSKAGLLSQDPQAKPDVVPKTGNAVARFFCSDC